MLRDFNIDLKEDVDEGLWWRLMLHPFERSYCLWFWNEDGKFTSEQPGEYFKNDLDVGLAGIQGF